MNESIYTDSADMVTTTDPNIIIGATIAGVIAGALLVLVLERYRAAQNQASDYTPLHGSPLAGHNSGEPVSAGFSVGWRAPGFDESDNDPTWVRGG